MTNRIDIHNIYVFLTPFHKKQISEILSLLPAASKEIIFYNEYIDVKEIKNDFPSASIIPISVGKVNFKKFLLKPLSEGKTLRDLFHSYWKIIDQELDNDKKYNLIIGQDKDVFIQIIINQLVNRGIKKEIIAVDEGTGFYCRNSMLKYPVMKTFYTLLSPVIFRTKIRYVERYGTHPQIDTVFVRFIDALGSLKARSKRYIQIPISEEQRNFDKVENSDRVLILTSPFSEDNEKTDEQEQLILSSLFSAIPSSKEIHVKQHPREREEKLMNFRKNNRIKFLNKSEVAETIRFEEYSFIIHFGSSVIMELFLIGYPLDHVVTFNPYSQEISLSYLFEQTIHVKLKKNYWEDQVYKTLSALFKPKK